MSDYILEIKVYKRSGPKHFLTGTKRPFAAIALLWCRGVAPPGSGSASLMGVWSFGTCLPQGSKQAFCKKKRGNLQQVKFAQIVHPPSHTVSSDTITIPKEHLVRGVVDENGVEVPVCV